MSRDPSRSLAVCRVLAVGWVLLVTLGAQPVARQWTWPEVRDLMSGGAGADGGVTAWAAASDLAAQGRERVELLPWASALALRIAADSRPLASSLPTRQALFAAALEFARRGGSPREAVAAAVLGSEHLGSEIAARRQMLTELAATSLGPHEFQLRVAQAIVEFAAEDYAACGEFLARAGGVRERLLAGQRDVWLLPEFFAVRARVHLKLGLLDLAHRDAELLAELAPQAPLRDYVALLSAMAGEEFERAVALAQRLRETASPHFSRAEVLRAEAMARARLEAPARAVPGLQDAIAAAQSIEVRAELLWAKSASLCSAGELAGAAAALGEGDALLSGLAEPRRAAVASSRAAAAAQLALARDDREALLASRAELLAARTIVNAAWDRLPQRPGGLGFLQFVERRAPYALLCSVERRLAPGRPELALSQLLPAHERGMLARRRGVALTDLGAIQAALGEGEGVLVYLPLPSVSGASHLFALTRDHVEHHVLDLDDRVRGQVRELQLAAVQRVGADELRPRAVELGRRLLPVAVAQRIASWRTVGIIGRDQLWNLPFELLAMDDGRWLGCAFPVHYLPSLAALLDARSAPPASGSAVLLAAPRSAAAPPIAVESPELRALLSPWREARLDADAAVASLAVDDALSARVLHLFGHGVDAPAAEHDERTSGVALRDRVLTCAEIESTLRERQPAVAVLSVCGAAAGPPRRGDDCGSHLAGAFLLAGTHAVIAADRDLRVDSNLRFCAALHEALASGACVAEAARRARVALLADVDTHPVDALDLGVWGRGSLVVGGATAQRRAAWPWVVSGVTAVALALWALGRLRRQP